MAIFCLYVTCSHASELGTISAKFLPSYASGQLYGCGISFEVLSRDWQYRQGGLIYVGGQFGVMSAKNKLAVVLKVVLLTFDQSKQKFVPTPPATAYFLSGNFRTTASLLVASTKSDTPGSLFSIFQLGAFSAIADGLVEGTVKIAFARTPGGADVMVPIAINPKLDSNRITDAKFYACSKTLAEKLAKHPK